MGKSTPTASLMDMVHPCALASTLLEPRWPQLQRSLDSVLMVKSSGICSIRARHLEQVSYHGEIDAGRTPHGYGTSLCPCVHTA